MGPSRFLNLADTAALLFAVPALTIVLSGGDRTLEVSGIVPVSMYVISFLCLLPLFCYAVVRSAITDGGGRMLQIYASTKGVWAPLALLCVVVLIGSTYPHAHFDTRGEFVKPVIMFCILTFSLSLGAIPPLLRRHRLILFVVFVVIIVGMLVDVFHPGTLSKSASRASGVSRNPGLAGALLLLVTASLVNWSQPRFRDFALWTITGAGVFCTLSRANALLAGLSFLAYSIAVVWHHGIGRFLRAPAVALASSVILLALGVNVLLGYGEMFDTTNAKERITFISTPSRWNADELSGEGRVALAREYLEYAARSPILGLGTGFSHTRFQPSHNLYIHYWAENGFIGLLVICLFLICAGTHFYRHRDYRGVVVVALIALYGLFRHHLFDLRSIVSLVGLLASLSVVPVRLGARHKERPCGVSLSAPSQHGGGVPSARNTRHLVSG